MGKFYIILFYLVMSLPAGSQGQFKTIVPQQSVVAGESFQVQYIIQETGKIGNFKAPAFTHFRFVSGPNQYNGSVATANGIKPVQNFVYTLEAIDPGWFTIHGAVAMVNGKPVKSNDVLLEVISKEKAAKSIDKNFRDTNPDYFLRPGDDPYEKIRQNLFLKMVVDRTTCFAGDPVVAIFKLYSRLESNSDIVKNPGFYGFTVYDMVNLSDKQMNTEFVNGKLFDVHTIRKVQLYPLQAGTFTIDAMEIKNNVEFSRSTVNKKIEQEIVEGIPGNNNEGAVNENTEVFETSMHTEPVVIRVKPVPVKNKPAAFNGAVGTFAISAAVVKNRIAKNEEGIFEITISGIGNFTQLNIPVINWPDGIEGFEPTVRDSLDKTKLPLTGSRTFRYSFICYKPGLYQLPSVNFSYFDPRKKNYKTISTTTTGVEKSNEEKQVLITAERKESIASKNARASRVAAGVVISLVIIVLAYWVKYKNKPAPVVKQEKTEWPSIDEGIALIGRHKDLSNKEFCTGLQQFIWKTLGNRLNLEGSAVNKEILFSKLRQERVGDEIVSNLQRILSECEMGMFTGAAFDMNRGKMLAEAKEVLEGINPRLNDSVGQASANSGPLL